MVWLPRVDASSLGGGGVKSRQVDGQIPLDTVFPVGLHLAVTTCFTYNPEVLTNKAFPG
jgi:hypothetical protein